VECLFQLDFAQSLALAIGGGCAGIRHFLRTY
jgi:hypothetical protein